jgi:hypothetical protein
MTFLLGLTASYVAVWLVMWRDNDDDDKRSTA